MRPVVWCIVVAAGSGSRFGGEKQYQSLGGRRVLDWAIDDARRGCPRLGIDGVVLVVPPHRLGQPEPGVDAVVAGGATRSASVRAGLAAVDPAAEVVVVHDAARPLAGVDLFDRVVTAVLGGADAAVPGVAVTDTLKRVRDGQVVGTVDRSDLVAVQTPQAFAAEALRRAHAPGPEATDDAALIEAMGGRVVVVTGRPDNLKITTPEDLARARATWDGTPSE
jgi:2-C-methyl-D-erythritol 4-phosphate cytidylyltransferase